MSATSSCIIAKNVSSRFQIPSYAQGRNGRKAYLRTPGGDREMPNFQASISESKTKDLNNSLRWNPKLRLLRKIPKRLGNSEVLVEKDLSSFFDDSDVRTKKTTVMIQLLFSSDSTLLLFSEIFVLLPI
ncbi:hypothetical protein F2Q68_00003802 [Brassica cretica]|uniref:Uncharacterized protein n=1 Tax=Brassica cretica TaxID=69181 RepID=A0A8S9JAV1_BRACR|nr:hypothetical protein F2Q68_00003802 [Brassica cretica]